MDVRTLPRSRRPPSWARHVVAATAGATLVAAGLALSLADQEVGFVVLCGGLVLGVWALSAIDHARTLASLADATVGDLAVPLPTLPARSAHPHRDVAWLPAGVPAVVALPDGGWGIVPRDTAEAAAARVGFDGRWAAVAQPVPVLDATTPIQAIGRVPRDSAAVLVDRGEPVPHGVTGGAIRDRAEAATAR